MTQIHKKAMNNVIVRVCLLFILLLILSLFMRADTLTFFWDESEKGNEALFVERFGASQTSCGHEEDAFDFIPASTACKWARTEFLIVFGIPSVDNDGRRRRRDLQRATCWTFPGVATRANGHSGSLLVLYALARHPAHGFAFSESLRLEAAQWHDIVTLPVNEGRVTTNKTIGQIGNWGNEAEIGMGRKTFLWFQLAIRAFPLAVHVGKGDDDMYINVPQYLADLRLLPRRGIYWGAFVGKMALKSKQMEYVDVKYMLGFCMTLAKDAAKAIVGYDPLRRIVSLPYSKENELNFRILNMETEDVMVGRALKETGHSVIFVADQWRCRFHDSLEEKGYRNISKHSVVVHHVRESDYHTYMSYFIDKGITIQNTSIYKSSPTMYWVRCPLN